MTYSSTAIDASSQVSGGSHSGPEAILQDLQTAAREGAPAVLEYLTDRLDTSSISGEAIARAAQVMANDGVLEGLKTDPRIGRQLSGRPAQVKDATLHL